MEGPMLDYEMLYFEQLWTSSVWLREFSAFKGHMNTVFQKDTRLLESKRVISGQIGKRVAVGRAS